MNIYFDEYFNVPIEIMRKYGAYNISLVRDLPLFIDPILLFESNNKEYNKLHDDIVKYLKFLRTKSANNQINEKSLYSWYMFPEIKQNWLGYSRNENKGNGLGIVFAKALNTNLNNIFVDFGDEKITRGSHLEKLCLFDSGIGKDNISDFTTNLIKKYLLEYTEKFSNGYIDGSLLKKFEVEKVRFNYDKEIWENGKYILPCKDDNYVILTPKNLLTKDDIFINRNDMYDNIDKIVEEITNRELRDKINVFFISELSQDMNDDERREIYIKLVNHYPEVMDYYIKIKENKKDEAVAESKVKISSSEVMYVAQVKELSRLLEKESKFYEISPCSYENIYERILCLKDIIENRIGHKYLYLNNKPITREYDLKLMFRLLDSKGRGNLSNCMYENSPVVNYKLASNKKLGEYFMSQVKSYKYGKNSEKDIVVVFCYSDKQLEKINQLCDEFKILDNTRVIPIDASVNKH